MRLGLTHVIDEDVDDMFLVIRAAALTGFAAGGPGGRHTAQQCQ